MVMLLALNILNKVVKDEDERDILKEFRDHLISVNFDVKNETIDSQNSLNEFANFTDFWLRAELMKDKVRDFKKCKLLQNIFLILHAQFKTFEQRVYIFKVKREYQSKYFDTVRRITSDSNFFLSRKEDDSDDNDLDNAKKLEVELEDSNDLNFC